jgi:hypothetical protein
VLSIAAIRSRKRPVVGEGWAKTLGRNRADGAAIDAATDGAATDGAATDGAATDGAATDGAATDGVTDGATDGVTDGFTDGVVTRQPLTTIAPTKESASIAACPSGMPRARALSSATCRT